MKSMNTLSRRLISLRMICLYITAFVVFESCKQEPKKPVIVQDETITPQTAITKLVFDSTFVANYLDSTTTNEENASQIMDFYIGRNFQYAWFNEDGIAEQTRTFWNLRQYYIQQNNDQTLRDTLFENKLNLLLEDTTFVLSDTIKDAYEIELTRNFFVYARYAYEGKIDPSDLQWHIPRKKLDLVALLDSLVYNKGQNVQQWEPVNVVYKQLQSKLGFYARIKDAGGWDTLPYPNKTWKIGAKDSMILVIKQRLILEDTTLVMDSSIVLDDAWADPIKKARYRYGLSQQAIVDVALIKELNISVDERIKQILINMERGRWLPSFDTSMFIIANIPDYTLRVFEDRKVAMKMNIVVGTAANNSVIFTDKMKYIVFAPYWNVPTSIVKNEIMPAMNRNKNYLARNHMEITGYNGKIPVVRQKPGKHNSLGLVKFLFPNNYNIYFHDTPSKSLFEREQRAFSHGCIRLQKPFELAQYLLRNDSTWTDEKIREAMNGDKEKWVTLKNAVPIMITYFTAWVDDENNIHFNKDVYGHDEKLTQRLFNIKMEVAPDGDSTAVNNQ